MDHREYLRKIASKGGKAGKGASKRRSPEQARKAARARWDRPKGKSG